MVIRFSSTTLRPMAKTSAAKRIMMPMILFAAEVFAIGRNLGEEQRLTI